MGLQTMNVTGGLKNDQLNHKQHADRSMYIKYFRKGKRSTEIYEKPI